jgi:polar amino acid transport system substrate-binding protein
MLRSFLAFFLLMGTSLVFGEQQSNLPVDVQNILSRGKLVVAMLHEDIPPFVIVRHDQLDGYDVAIAKDIAQQLGVKLVFNREAKTYDEVIDQLIKGKADIAISLLSRTLPRAMKVNFSDPYLSLHQALLVNRIKAIQLKLEDNPITALNQPSATIAVLANSSYVTFAKNYYPKATIIPYNNLAQAMLDVKNGNILTVLFDEIQIKNWLDKHPEAHLYVQMLILEKQIDPIAIAIPWQNTHFLRWVNLYLSILKEDEKGKQLVNHYLKDSKWLN